VKITLRTVGGFTGPAGAQTHVVDVDELPPADAERLLGHVTSAVPEGLPRKLMKAAPQPWDFVRHLKIEDGETVREFQFHDEAASVSLRQLVQEIEELSGRT